MDLELAIEIVVADIAGERKDAVHKNFFAAGAVAQYDLQLPVRPGNFFDRDPAPGLDGRRGAGGQGRSVRGEPGSRRQRISCVAPPGRRGGTERPDDAGAGSVLCQRGEVACRGLRRVAGAGEEDRLAGPVRRLPGEVGDRPPDRPVLSRRGAFAGCRDAAVAEVVGVAVGAGGVDDDRRVLRALAAVRSGDDEAERPAAPLGGRDLFMLEQALAADRHYAGAEAQVGSDGRQGGEGGEKLFDQLATGRAFGGGRRRGRQVAAHARRDVQVPGREQADIPPGADVTGDFGRGFVDGEREAGLGGGQRGFEPGGAGPEDGDVWFGCGVHGRLLIA